MRKAFDESVQSNDTIGGFIQKTQSYTEGQHPVARLVPASLNVRKCGRRLFRGFQSRPVRR